jgi:hypothetical protein
VQHGGSPFWTDDVLPFLTVSCSSIFSETIETLEAFFRYRKCARDRKATSASWSDRDLRDKQLPHSSHESEQTVRKTMDLDERTILIIGGTAPLSCGSRL